LLEHLARLTTDHPTELRQLNELTNYAGLCASATHPGQPDPDQPVGLSPAAT
jgi:hypothetical protein